MRVAGQQVQVTEEQEVSKPRALAVADVAVRHTDFSEENTLSDSVLIFNVPQAITSKNS